VGFVSLGCPKNLVDTEVMMGRLRARGHELTPHPEQAEVIVVNTCAFIEPAKQESVDTILEMARYKKTGQARKLIVAGCLVEGYRGEIRDSIPEGRGRTCTTSGRPAYWRRLPITPTSRSPRDATTRAASV